MGMDTDTGITGSRRTGKADCFPVLLLFVFVGPATAEDWRIQPSVSLAGIYSDNIFLRPDLANAGFGPREDAFVTEIRPGLSVRREGRSRFYLDYLMQNLFYAGPDIEPRINNQLQMRSHAELLDESLFVDSTSTIGQFNNTTTGRIAVDNVSRTGNTSTYRTFRLSPYWTPHFGNYADGLARVGYSNIAAGTDGVDSDIFEELLYFRSGTWFNPVGWRANFYNQDNQRNGGGGQGDQNVVYRNYNGEVRLRLTEALSPFIQAGEYDNEFLGRDRVKQARNGGYWTAGLAWTPTPKFALLGGYGINNYFGSLRWNPGKRTALQVTYRFSEVGGALTVGGLGTTSPGFGSVAGAFGSGIAGGGTSGFGALGGGIGGYGGGFGGGSFGQLGGFNAGTTWNALLTHRTRRTTWGAAYWVSNTTIQQVLLDREVFPLTDPQGNPITDPFVDGTNRIPIDQPNLVNEAITRKRGQVTVAGHTAKTNLSLSGYQERRAYQFSGDQDVLGVSASWGWRFGPRTRSIVSFTWQEIDSRGFGFINSNDQFMTVSLALIRNIWTDLNGSLELRHVQQDSDNAINEYDENRVTARLYMFF
jgi:hypothetical protein